MKESLEQWQPSLEQNSISFSLEEEKFLQKKVQDMKDGALLEEDFEIQKHGDQYRGLYDTKEVLNDKKDVIRLKSSFKEKEKKRYESESSHTVKMFEDRRVTAEYLEALFYEKLGGADGWIPNSFVYKTSEFDDIKNGIDFVIELEEDHFGLAIDVTLTNQSKEIISKLKAIQLLIDRGQFQEVKYYESPQGKQGSVPVAIVALDYKHAVQALKFWADGEDKLLSKHPTRVKAWLETREQFDAFSSYAEAMGQTEIAKSYKEAISLIQHIIDQNNEDVQKYSELIKKDDAYKIISEYCFDLKRFATQAK